MSHVVAEVAPPVGTAGGTHGIECATDGAVADGVEVTLEPGRVECGDVSPELDRVDEVDPAALRWPALLGEVRLEHCGGEILGDPIEHELDRGWREPTGDPSPLSQLFDLLGSPVPLPPQRTDDARLQLPIG